MAEASGVAGRRGAALLSSGLGLVLWLALTVLAGCTSGSGDDQRIESARLESEQEQRIEAVESESDIAGEPTDDDVPSDAARAAEDPVTEEQEIGEGDGIVDESSAASEEPTEGGTDVDADGGDPADSGGEAAAEPVPADDLAILSETGDGLAGADLEAFLARRYKAYWRFYGRATSAPTTTPEQDHPALFALAAGEQLEQAYDAIKALHGEGHAIRRPEEPAVPGLGPDDEVRVRIVSLEEGVAELMSCLVNDDVRYRRADGEVVSANVVSATATATMARTTTGTWKLIRSRAVGLAQGVGGCWAEGEAAYPL